MDDLKKCPFCGGAAKAMHRVRRYGYLKINFVTAHCMNCGVDGPEREEESDAIQAWNSRK